MRTLSLYVAVCFCAMRVASGGEPVDYVQHVKPILAAKCFSCHGALKQESGLRLDAASLLRRGGDSGPAIEPGKSAQSLLIEKVAAAEVELRMPPEGEGEPLSVEQIGLLRKWIDGGAVAPDELIPPDPREHWAYQPPQRPVLPQNTDDANSPIDTLLAAAHAKSGLTPAPAAAREILLRRVYLDLIGLPPTRQELHAFLDDESPEAYGRVVDRLLKSPQHGERWGRHWMDVWRYSDWAGYGAEIRYSQRHIWRWRDWIIESLNADKGYDRMVHEMLAADELAPGDSDAARATGFLARNWYKFDRNVWLDDAVEHTSKAFLGITFKCARCHDHKYDPISQGEYYRMRAVFEPYDVRTDRAAGQLDVKVDGLVRVFDAKAETPTYLFVRGDPKRPDKEHPLAPGVPAVVSGPEFEVQPVSLPVESYYPAMRTFVGEEMIASAQAAVSTAETALADARGKLAKATARDKQPKVSPPAEVDKIDEDPTELFGKTFLDDNFTKADPDAWKTVRGQWEYVDGRLVQKQIVSGFSPIVTVRDHPLDFAATLRFKPTGGNTYRSVGLSFDWVADREFQAVYLSAKDGGSTLSAFHRSAGRDVYPPQAIVPHKIQVGQEAKLEVLVRGNVINIKVDGSLKLAYRLPVARQPGKFALWTYDATAEFDHLRISELPAEIKLAPPAAAPAVTTKDKAEPSKEQAQQAVALAEKKLATAQARLASVEARVAAERAKHQSPSEQGGDDRKEQLKQLAIAAGGAERLAALAAAEEQNFAAELALQRARAARKEGDAKSQQAVTAAEKKLTAAGKAVEAAQKGAAEETAKYQTLGPTYPQASSGRRLTLARWIADRRNPLTARVAVNHIWLRHFGRPLVENVDDFGLRSSRPPLVALLDLLAVELMENNWSMKHVHRLIVNSAAYRMASRAGGEDHPSRQRDPDNKLFWRADARRMEAETVRDTVLYVAGNLDLTRGGPDIDHKQGLTVARRSLYFRHAREKQMPLLQIFDAANPRECYRRRESIRPQQAFALVNSSLALAQSRKLAARLSADESPGQPLDDERFIEAVFETILSRAPREAERAECRRFLELQAAQLADTAKLELLGTASNAVPASADPDQRARENLVLVLLNHNDFVTIR